MKTDWHHLHIDGIEAALSLSQTLQSQADGVAGTGVAIFSRLDAADGSTHFYFSPAAAALARAHGALQCVKPALNQVGGPIYGGGAIFGLDDHGS